MKIAAVSVGRPSGSKYFKEVSNFCHPGLPRQFLCSCGKNFLSVYVRPFPSFFGVFELL